MQGGMRSGEGDDGVPLVPEHAHPFALRSLLPKRAPPHTALTRSHAHRGPGPLSGNRPARHTVPRNPLWKINVPADPFRQQSGQCRGGGGAGARAADGARPAARATAALLKGCLLQLGCKLGLGGLRGTQSSSKWSPVPLWAQML